MVEEEAPHKSVCRLPPLRPRQLQWQRLSDITVLDLWRLLKACNVQEKNSCSKLQSVLVNLSSPDSSSYSSLPLAMGQEAVHIFSSWHSLYTACRSQGVQKGPCLPNTDNLCSDHQMLLLKTEVQTSSRSSLLLHHPHTTTSPSSL